MWRIKEGKTSIWFRPGLAILGLKTAVRKGRARTQMSLFLLSAKSENHLWVSQNAHPRCLLEVGNVSIQGIIFFLQGYPYESAWDPRGFRMVKQTRIENQF
jgi:hypothetical protein